MIRACWLVLLPLAVTETPWLLKDAADGYSYHAKGFGELDIDGVCSVTPSRVSCWRPDGTPDAALTDAADAQLQSDKNTPLRYRAPNLLLVNSQTGLAGVRAQIFAGHPYTGLPSDEQLTGAAGQPPRSMSWLPADEGEKSANVVMSVPISLGSVRLPLRRGAHAAMGNMTVTLGSAHPIEATSWPYPTRQLAEWRITYSIDGTPAGAIVRLNPAPLGKSGRSLKMDAHRAAELSALAMPPNYFIGEVQNGPRYQTAWYTDCDPKKIGFIELRPTYQRQVTFRNVALQPKSR